MKLAIYWLTNNRTTVKRICERFKIEKYITVNGETPCDIQEADIPLLQDDIPLLQECQKRGFLKIRHKK